ncbi:MAG: hypothetical protein AAFR36_31550, partial [Bacteroidota bacterium]
MIFSGAYFAEHQQKILGEVVTHNPNTGRELTDQFGKPRPEVSGNLLEAIAQIPVDLTKVKRYDHFYASTTKRPVQHSLQAKSKATAVIAKSMAERQQRGSSRYTCQTGLQCLEDTIVKYNADLSPQEIKVWVTYQVQ